MTTVELGKAGLQGWRAKVADVMGPVVARSTPASENQARAAIGALFFVLSVVYVVKTVRQWVVRS
jgi:hypothetical protein